jgi:uncharacterized RDD family membrane protein YckC
VSVEEGAPVALPNAGVFRRLGAMFYDALLIVALMFVLTGLFLLLTGGEAILASQRPVLAAIYNVARLGVFVGFFGLFWTRRGQTLGMAAWRMRVVRVDGSRLGWMDVLKRLAAATVSLLPLGLGYWWLWIDREGLTWHDRWTHTRMVVEKKAPRT